MLLGIAVLASAAVLVFGAWYFSDGLRCPGTPEDGAGESNYGEAEWAWFPIGTTCRWTEADNGFDRIEEPGWAPTILIAAMLTTGLGLVLTSSPRRSDRLAKRPGAGSG
jgi:hypothetical protein